MKDDIALVCVDLSAYLPDFEEKHLKVIRTKHGCGNFQGLNIISAVVLPVACKCDWCMEIKQRISSRTGMIVS